MDLVGYFLCKKSRCLSGEVGVQRILDFHLPHYVRIPNRHRRPLFFDIHEFQLLVALSSN